MLLQPTENECVVWYFKNTLVDYFHAEFDIKHFCIINLVPCTYKLEICGIIVFVHIIGVLMSKM